jgi:ubiquinone/menaquinone biosynthesis C-methylase UbiE
MQDIVISQGEISKLYDGLAKVYDIWGKLAESKARKRAIELANISDKQKIIEVAVGTGLAFKDIVNRNPNGENYGIDISNGMLDKAKMKMKKITSHYVLEIGSAFNLKYTSNYFDILFNNYMFDLMPSYEMEKILHEFRRVLKQNGALILINMTEAETFVAKIYEWIYKLSPRLIGGCRGVTLSDLIQKNGFRVESREYIQQLLFPSEVIVAYKK